MKLHIVPIEPMVERYSAQWLRWFDGYLQQTKDISYKIYDPLRYLETELTTRIKTGEFLDVVETNNYKAWQLVLLTNEFMQGRVGNDDVFLFLDGWFPGLEMLAYIRDGLGLKTRFVGMFHAGTYDPNDYLSQRNMGKWGKSLEEAWFAIYDKVVVATTYHRVLLLRQRRIDPDKIITIFFPMLTNWLVRGPKQPGLVVFPHRLAPEKNPDAFGALSVHPDIKNRFTCVFTQSKSGVSKEEYWSQLRQAQYAVSFAKQETWGIAMIESVLSGCIPIVPDRLSYHGLYPPLFRYTPGDDEVASAADALLQLDAMPEVEVQGALSELQQSFIQWGSEAISKIVTLCYTLG